MKTVLETSPGIWVKLGVKHRKLGLGVYCAFLLSPPCAVLSGSHWGPQAACTKLGSPPPGFPVNIRPQIQKPEEASLQCSQTEGRASARA